jgi:hypothetical protein
MIKWGVGLVNQFYLDNFFLCLHNLHRIYETNLCRFAPHSQGIEIRINRLYFNVIIASL